MLELLLLMIVAPLILDLCIWGWRCWHNMEG